LNSRVGWDVDRGAMVQSKYKPRLAERPPRERALREVEAEAVSVWECAAFWQSRWNVGPEK